MYFLPLYADKAQNILNTGDWQLECEDNASYLATVYLLLVLPELYTSGRVSTPIALEREIGRIVMALQGEQATLKRHLHQKFTIELYKEGIQVVVQTKGAFLDVNYPVDIDTQMLINTSGQSGWNFDFATKYDLSKTGQTIVQDPRTGKTKTISDDQDRLMREVIANPEESTQVQGFSGTGKTYLLSSIMSAVPTATTLVVASSNAQAHALYKRILGLTRMYVQVTTHTALLDKVDSTILPNHAARSCTLKQYKCLQMLSPACLDGIGYAETLSVIAHTLRRFCNSEDSALALHHIPVQYQQRNQPNWVGEVDHKASDDWVIAIQKVWDDLVVKRVGFGLLITRQKLYVWKLLALSGATIKPEYTHIIVDEAHDLPNPLLQVLHAGGQTLVMMGDDYQGGTTRSLHKSGRVAHNRYLTQSHRASRHIDDTVNTMLHRHPNQPTVGFSGMRRDRTHISSYSDFVTPTTGRCQMIVRDQLELLATYFSYCNRRTQAAIAELDMPRALVYAKGLLQLRYGLKADDLSLQRYKDMEGFFSSLDARGVRELETIMSWLDSLPQSTYIEQDIANYVTRLGQEARENGNAVIVLSTLSNAKNQQFHQVVVSNRFVPDEKDVGRDLAIKINQLYTATTRVQSKLWLPEQLDDFLHK